MNDPPFMTNGRLPRFAGRADQPAFEAWLLASGYPAEIASDMARMTCGRLRGDDDLFTYHGGLDAWATYQSEITDD